VQGHWQKILSITTDASRPNETVWNVAITPASDADDGAVEAEGIVVGDLNLQHDVEGGNRHGQ
ncbi:MAG: hypothetical protein M3Q07_20270, partial [Pseudobdellovibrionaceae bacterium]|nr:hypothetical protein [Pseudobdellovibrionaceae bacterium]